MMWLPMCYNVVKKYTSSISRQNLMYTITYKSSLTPQKMYNKTDAIFSIYGKNRINQ